MIKWYTDASAKEQHARIAEHLRPMIAQFLGPGYELSHLGINKNDTTGEVVLRLHLNPIGRISVAGEPLRIEVGS
jgi:hypothetical protein